MSEETKIAEQARGVKYGCHADLDPGQEPDACVKDTGDDHDCIYASRHRTREGCRYWQPIDGKAVEGLG